MKNKTSLVLFIAGVVIAGSLIGITTAPGDWYANLAKPSFNPPSWIFAPVWTMLYVLMGIAGWRSWVHNPAGNLFIIWVAQMTLNFAWSPVFFAMQNAETALAVILALLAAILMFIAVGWRRDRMAAWLFVPYAGWVAFATLLNLSIVRLN